MVFVITLMNRYLPAYSQNVASDEEQLFSTNDPHDHPQHNHNDHSTQVHKRHMPTDTKRKSNPNKSGRKSEKSGKKSSEKARKAEKSGKEDKETRKEASKKSEKEKAISDFTEKPKRIEENFLYFEVTVILFLVLSGV